jgi:threonine aldolase
MGYGLDRLTMEVLSTFRELLHEDAEVFLLWSGTAANVLGLKAVLLPHQAVVCTEHAHLYADETGAPEQYVGCKLFGAHAPDAKLTPELIEPYLVYKGDPHRPTVRVVSVTQTTEYGTLYTLEQLRAIKDLCQRHGLLLQMDGARLANAAVALGCSFKEMTVDVGVDILSFGGSKNGLMGAEALCFLTPGLANHFLPLQKQGMQLSSKMRFLAAQFKAYFADELWRHNALHANTMAQRLYQGVKDLPGLQLTQPVQANALFARIPTPSINRIKEHISFHIWDPYPNPLYPGTQEVRWMTAWDTPPEHVDQFIGVVRSVLN